MFKLDIKVKNFIKSTFYVCIVSLFAGMGGYLLGYNFLAFFLLFAAIQYILFSAISSLIISFFVEKTKQKELDKLENLSTILNCAYCNQPNVMTFLPQNTSRLELECDSCKKKNVVTIGFTVARITEIVNVPTVTGIPLE
jgi:uncharacterized membrane protein